MNFTKEHITNISNLLMKYGIRNISMDNIAQELGISKKTLYTWFPSKEQMLDAVIDHFISTFDEKNCHSSIAKDSENAIDFILLLISKIGEVSKQINPIFFWELNKYYPVQAKKLNDFRIKHIRQKIIQNLERGINEGLYRDNINIEIVSQMYVILIKHFHEIIYQDELQKFPIEKILKEIYLFHIHAIVNDKGREYLRKKLNLNEL
jgi:predicted DNA-binding protein YlxM (UPF0122 family)